MFVNVSARKTSVLNVLFRDKYGEVGNRCMMRVLQPSIYSEIGSVFKYNFSRVTTTLLLVEGIVLDFLPERFRYHVLSVVRGEFGCLIVHEVDVAVLDRTTSIVASNSNSEWSLHLERILCGVLDERIPDGNSVFVAGRQVSATPRQPFSRSRYGLIRRMYHILSRRPLSRARFLRVYSAYSASKDRVLSVQGSSDLLSHHIFLYLPWQDVFNCRAVCRAWKTAASDSPLPELYVDCISIARNLPLLSTALSNVQKIRFGNGVSRGTEYLARFRNLRYLELPHSGYRTIPREIFCLDKIQCLDLSFNDALEWNLSDVASLSQLSELQAASNSSVNGDLKSLHILSGTIVRINISNCPNVTGDLRDLAVFPLLENAKIDGTGIVGNISDIRKGEFTRMKDLCLNYLVKGAGKLERMKDAAGLMLLRCQVEKRVPGLRFTDMPFLPRDSVDSYECPYLLQLSEYPDPPFQLESVHWGPRSGWRWIRIWRHNNATLKSPCDIQWIDPEPSMGDAGYDEYCAEQTRLEWEDYSEYAHCFQGFSVPPTFEEYVNIAMRYSVPRNARDRWYSGPVFIDIPGIQEVPPYIDKIFFPKLPAIVILEESLLIQEESLLTQQQNRDHKMTKAAAFKFADARGKTKHVASMKHRPQTTHYHQPKRSPRFPR